METVVTAIIIIFILMFGVLTLSGAFLDSQEIMMTSWEEMEQEVIAQSGTSIEVVEAVTRENGTSLRLTLANTGTTRLANFAQWEVIVQTQDASVPPAVRVDRLQYVAPQLSPTNGQWTIPGMYLNPAQPTPSPFEPLHWNPGEALVVYARPFNVPAPGSELRVFIGNGEGARAEVTLRENTPPLVTTNTGMAIAHPQPRTITADMLSATDPDDASGTITYTIDSAPGVGYLERVAVGSTPAATASAFTQTDVDAGRIRYVPGDYLYPGTAFGFTVSDGNDALAGQVFNLTLSQPFGFGGSLSALLDHNGTLTLDSGMMNATDADDSAAALVYTLVTPPLQGDLTVNGAALALGGTFTQDDVNAGRVAYAHKGTGIDSFRFTVTDGETTGAIGTFRLNVPVPTLTPSPTP